MKSPIGKFTSIYVPNDHCLISGTPGFKELSCSSLWCTPPSWWLHFSNGLRTILVDTVLQEPPQEKNLGVQIWRMWGLLRFAMPARQLVRESLVHPLHCDVCCTWSCSTLMYNKNSQFVVIRLTTRRWEGILVSIKCRKVSPFQRRYVLAGLIMTQSLREFRGYEQLTRDSLAVRQLLYYHSSSMTASSLLQGGVLP